MKQAEIDIAKVIRNQEWLDAQEGKSQDWIDGAEFAVQFLIQWQLDSFLLFTELPKQGK